MANLSEIMSDVAGTAKSAVGKIWTWVLEQAGGPARLQVILLLSSVLGLATADLGTVSAVSGLLKSAFDISNTGVGLLLAVVSFVGAIGTLPAGVLADRIDRRRILVVAMLVWGAAQVASGFAASYVMLLITRLAVGAIIAASWPCVASLTGDFFPARERASVYGLIVSGELIGAGIGFFISGEVSSFGGWRWAFFVMAAFSPLLAWLVWRFLPEPQRGGQAWLRPGTRDPNAAATGRDAGTEAAEPSQIQEQVLEANVTPREDRVLHEDPTNFGLWRAIVYLLRLPTYRLLIVASSLAYYFLAGFRTFAMIYFTRHYGLPRTTIAALVFAIGIGVLVGLVAGGRISERLLDRGRFDARIIVPAVALFASVPFLGFGIWISSAWIGVIVLIIGAGLLAAAVAPIDAARLDIVHPRMWGRGEAGRTALRSIFEGGAPLLFGALSDWLGGGAKGLEWTFLIMLLPLIAAGLLVVPGRRAYPRDVATAAASLQASQAADQ